MPETTSVSASALTGSTIFQSLPLFWSDVVSPDEDFTLSASMAEAWTVKTFSRGFASSGLRFDSTK